MTTMQGLQPSVNARAGKLVEELVASATALRCAVTIGEAGERRIDLGASVHGGLEAGRRLGEICMGGLGTVSITSASGLERWPLGVVVHSTNPVIACLGEPVRRLDHPGAGDAVSSPSARVPRARSRASRSSTRSSATSIITTRRPSSSRATRRRRPPSRARSRRPAACNPPISPFSTRRRAASPAPCRSRPACSRSRSTRRMRCTSRFEHIVDGFGVAPIAPPIPDFVKAMGRTNDAIIYGGRIQLFVRGPDDAAKKLADAAPVEHLLDLRQAVRRDLCRRRTATSTRSTPCSSAPRRSPSPTSTRARRSMPASSPPRSSTRASGNARSPLPALAGRGLG